MKKQKIKQAEDDQTFFVLIFSVFEVGNFHVIKEIQATFTQEFYPWECEKLLKQNLVHRN